MSPRRTRPKHYLFALSSAALPSKHDFRIGVDHLALHSDDANWCHRNGCVDAWIQVLLWQIHRPFFIYDSSTHCLVRTGATVVHYTCLLRDRMSKYSRTFVYPFQLKSGSGTPWYICLSAVAFCSWNGYIQGSFHGQYFHPEHFFSSVTTYLGMALFATGMYINIQSDSILRNLRKPGEAGYKIPRGGMFEYVSGANFFGEIVEWFGYALMSGSLPAIAFAMFTASNIGPRAVHHHRWYHEKFPDYPKSRKALIPFLL
ncbi:hypothetical protein Q1695_014639 [Nippostrongylus brasiliensis]|nr:hypothetical protein Q1695_014639 [Nippostrongylus brasiliensis]